MQMWQGRYSTFILAGHSVQVLRVYYSKEEAHQKKKEKKEGLKNTT